MLNWGLLGLLCAGTLWSLPVGRAPVPLPAHTKPEAFQELQTAGLPLAPEVKLGASELIPTLAEKSERERDELLVSLLEAGHFPDFLRHLRPVQVHSGEHRLVFWVMPDYLSIGSDDDFLLVPLSWTATRHLAKRWGFAIPTARMVDRIYSQAERVIWPKTYPPGPHMRSLDAIIDHNNWISSQRYLYPDKEVLTAGHKKDLVITRRLYQQPDRVAIYGWQNIRDGEPIQPLSLWHGDFYADYSHGIRMVAPWVLYDGALVPLGQALLDPETAPLLSHEGTLDLERIFESPGDSSLAQNSIP